MDNGTGTFRGRIRPCVLGIFGRAIVVAALCASPFVQSARAGDMQVLESNVVNYTIGMVLRDDAKFDDLPPGGRVKVLLRPSNYTKLFVKPSADPKQDQTGGVRSLPREND
jgi:hypothetical protein